jgi:hypothetical protein
MGVGGTVLGSLAVCLIIALIIELKERDLDALCQFKRNEK